LTSSQENF